MRLKAVSIVLFIIASLLPVYMVYQYLQKKIRPRDSMRRFLAWLLATFVLIFGYTFLVVFVLKLLFPGA